ncbi:MAG: HAMP domain-containing protein [Chlorobiaceae bacterium]|nr:HAMP domain-containing protein [Chlorobiaceae bacterium]
MIGIRQKLVLGFSGVLLIVAAMGWITIRQIDQLGGAIDVILKQNYRSVVACQDMTEALERIDSGVLFTFSGHYDEGMNNIREHELNFRKALGVELGNITLPGEGQKALQIRSLFSEYIGVVKQVTEPSLSLSKRQRTYFSTLLPLFRNIKQLSGQVLEMNQSNMNEANNSARVMAASAHNIMLSAIVASAVFAVLFSYLSHRWILMPLKKLIASAEEIRKGNLELVIDTDSTDEIGKLSESFNEMAATLRKMRKSDQETLLRTRRVTQEVFKVLPTPIAVLDLNGIVEVSTESADHYFGLKKGVNARDLGYEWLTALLQKALRQGSAAEYRESNGFVQHFAGNQEYFFQPMAVPVPAGMASDEFAGTALILKDVTQLHEQLELKHSVISTVSHQLRTPLTSLRMSIHLLLEERVGQLNEKQEDLLFAAREETERLVHILDDLLDINRIESGKAHLNFTPVVPFRISVEGIEPFLIAARDKGVSIVNATIEGLPEILADKDSLRHVYANLLSNALRFTSPGGTVTVSASEELGNIKFSIADTGAGIASEHIEHLFEQFYRVPGQEEKSGIGLGLSIVKEIIEAHGGKVGAESISEKGSVFWFTIPMQKNTS